VSWKNRPLNGCLSVLLPELKGRWWTLGKAEKYATTTEDLPRLLSISDELFGSVVVVAVTAVYVAYWSRHLLHRHGTLGVDLRLRQRQVVVKLNLTRPARLYVV